MSERDLPTPPADDDGAAASLPPMQRALLALRKARERLDILERGRSEPIAIVGMACRFPGGGSDPEAFFRSLRAGVDAVGKIPAERWRPEEVASDAPGVRWAALLERVDGFDAAFFGIAPREATTLDPQQRLLLEVAWESLEDAGARADVLAGSRTGVFVGICNADYRLLVADRVAAFDAYAGIGNAYSTAAGRISYQLGLQGPCLAIDTACSSSLVAVHYACQSLRGGESEVALAGGVNLILSAEAMDVLAGMQALSPDGRCRTFDARANGFVRGEGAGMLVLKRLSDAQRDGDRIHAVIRGSAVNQDGRSTGLTAPNVRAQEAMLRQALAAAKVAPEEIGYVETHGTGTALGDPIELEALGAVFGQPRGDGSACVLGAVKTNVGHLEAAAGVAGLIKAALCLRHEEIPPNQHFRALNPRVSLAGTPFVIPTEARPWPRSARPRRAGVSSFGISGTNAHVVLEEAPGEDARAPTDDASAPAAACHALPLSAATGEALAALAAAYAEVLARGDASLHDVAYTAGARRSPHAERLVVVGDSREELAAALAAAARGELPAAAARGTAPMAAPAGPVFVLSGQGAQWAGMGQTLYATEPVFRAAIDACDELVLRHAGWSLAAALAEPAATSRLAATEVAQPALFAVAVALAALLRSWGITPGAVIGHSVGEIAAAHLAGALSLDAAVRLVCARGRLLQRATGRGAMAAVALAPDEAARALAGHEELLAIAAVNDPGAVVLSGEPAALAAVLASLEARGVRTRRLPVDYAFHSPQMAPLARELAADLGAFRGDDAAVPMYSTVTGARVAGPELDGAYWARNVREPVRLADAMAAAMQHGHRAFVEIGPHAVLLPNLARCLAADAGAFAVATLRREQPERRALLATAGRLYVQGHPVAWERLFPARGHVVSLPAYPWQRERFWVDGDGRARKGGDAATQPAVVEDVPCHELAWFEAATPADRPRAGRRVLVLAGTGGFGESLAGELRASGDACVVVRAPDIATTAGFDDVVHLGALDAPAPGDDVSPQAVADAAEACCASVLRLLPRLAGPARLWLVTRGAQVADRGSAAARVAVAQAPLWGLGRTIALEHPELWGATIDLDPAASARDAGDLARVLRAADGEDEIALRGGRRWHARLVAAPLPPTRTPFAARADASYLITGGLGGLGLELARWLVDGGARHLVLVGRSGVRPERAEAVRALEARGATVTVVAADVADEDAMARALAAIEPPLAGVIHAAGVGTWRPLVADDTAAVLTAAFRAKVHGAAVLDRLTRAASLDFFVLFSSAAAVWGGRSQGHYAAANAFLDALAHERRACGLPATSVDWGVWADGTMGRDDDGGARLRAVGVRAMPSALALDALARLLESGAAQRTVAAVDWPRFKSIYESGARRRILERIDGTAPAAPTGVPAGTGTTAAAAAPAATAMPQRTFDEPAIEAAVRAAVARELGLASGRALPGDRPLRDLGLDSLMAVGVRDALGAWCGRSLPATLVFDHPTVQALARFLRAELGPADAAAPAPAPPAAIVATETAEPIAILGIGCRYPGGADDPDSFWRIVADGVDVIGEVPRDRWDAAALYDPDPEVRGKTTTRSGGFLGAIDQFDPAFFGISPREAAAMDPQQRLLLETTWEALEHAGIPPATVEGTDAGVFVGLISNEYMSLHGLDDLDGYVGTGSAGAVASGRISYFLGAKGPSLTVDTACSSSLVAIHLACRSLRSGESSLALAGGVTLMLTPTTQVEFARMRGNAPDGRCKAFDSAADGVGWSDGCGIVVLKRLADARRDGDRVLAVIRGTAVNQDGRSNGLTAPNGPSQEAVIRRALGDAGIEPAAVDYVEAHGTGTPLGDPIEAQALGAVLADGRPADRPVVLGSVKSNLGHTQAAAGVAGLIKVVLALQHGVIPPTLHLRAPNVRVAWERLPIRLAAEAVPWPAGTLPRLAGVSAFGVSGTNAHLIVADAPVDEAAAGMADAADGANDDDGLLHVMPLSAHSPAALRARAADIAELLRRPDAPALADVAYTAAVRRGHARHRLAVSGRSAAEVADALSSVASGADSAAVTVGAAPSTGRAQVVFVFPGQGAQWAGMGRSLLDGASAFDAALRACDAALRPEVDFSVVAAVRDGDPAVLGRIDAVQPLIFAVQVALAAQWRAWGVEPDAVVGHSMGEVAAACVAGALTLADGARVIARRSRLLLRARGAGGMALVELPFAEAEAELATLGDRVAVAADNGPRATVLAGEPAALDALLASLAARGVWGRRVAVDVASHSAQMDPLLDDLRAALAELRPAAPAIAMQSTVTGARVAGPELDAAYWARNLRAPVRFGPVAAELAAAAPTIFLELSPHPLLGPALAELARGHAGTAVVASMRRDVDARATLREAYGALFAHGATLPWTPLHPRGGRVVTLPTYPFQRARHWLDAAPARPAPPRAAAGGHPLLGHAFTTSTQPGGRFWSVALAPALRQYLADHRVHGAIVLPGAAHIELALAAARSVAGTAAVAISVEELAFARPLVLDPDALPDVELALLEDTAGAWTLRVSSRAGEPDATWQLHASGTLRIVTDAPAATASLAELRRRCASPLDLDAQRARELAQGLDLGPAFRALEQVWRGDAEALGRLALPPALAHAAGHELHPALLDAAIQVLGAALGDPADASAALPVLASVRRFRLHRRPTAATGWSHASARAVDANEIEGRLALFDDAGELLAELEGITLRRAAAAVAPRLSTSAPLLDQLWQLADAPSTAAGADGRWLLVGDPDALSDALAAQLTARGASVTRVGLDHEGGPALDDVIAAGAPWKAVVHLGALAPTPADPLAAELDAAQVRGCFGALRLTQALARAAGRHAPRLVLVTRGTQALDGAAEVAAAHAPLWGLGRVIALEHPELSCTSIDLNPRAAADDADALVRELLVTDGEPEVALRDGHRHVGRLARLADLTLPPADLAAATPVRADGTYLIIGGLGGLGLLTAGWLVDEGARHLVVVTRHGARTPAQTEALAALAARGADVVTMEADLADEVALARVFADLRGRAAPLRGVIHAAGVLEDGLLSNQDPARFRRVFAAKVLGAWNLHRATRALPLDLFVLYSSASALLGVAGLGNYVAANVFLDALAHHRRRLGLHALSIDWGAFAGVGMGQKAEREGRAAERGMHGFTAAEGAALFRRLLRSERAQLGVVGFDARQWFELNPLAARSPRFATLLAESRQRRAAPARDAALARTLREASPADRHARLADLVREQVARVLRLPVGGLDPAAPLRTLGMDSIMGIEFRNRLEAELGLTLPATLAWTYPTAVALTEHLDERLAPAVAPAPVALPLAAPAPAVLAADDDLLSAFDDAMKRMDAAPLS